MMKKKIMALICFISFIFTIMGLNAYAAEAVTGLTCSGSGPYTFSWTNPASEDFVYNKITYEYNGKVKEVVENASDTSFTAKKESGYGVYLVTVESFFKDGSSAKAICRKAEDIGNDSSSIPGWSLECMDRPNNLPVSVYQYEVGLSQDAYSGNFAARVNITGSRAANLHVLMKRNVAVAAGKSYQLKFRFKTNGYGSDGQTARIRYGLGNVGGSVNVANSKYPEGEWHEVSANLVSRTAGATLMINLDGIGEVLIDDVSVCQAGGGDNLIVGTASACDGGFECDAFLEKPIAPTDLTSAPGFRSAELKWDTSVGSAKKVKVYSGEKVVAEAPFSDGSVNVDGLVYGENVLDVTYVSRYSVESDALTVSANTLETYVGKPEFSRALLVPGTITATVKIGNDGENELKSTLVLALYNGNKLEKLEIADGTALTGELNEIIASVDIPEKEGDYSVTAYTWDDFFNAGKAYAKPNTIK